MRHKVAGKHLSRTSAHRRALRRNLASSLFEHGTISTTREKAKFVKPFAEKLITLAKDGSLHARRRAIALLRNRNICMIEDGEPVKVDTVVGKLFKEIGPRFSDRNGGYTRIINLPLRRIGDNGQLVLLQLVGELKAASKEPVASEPSETQAAPDTQVFEESPADEESSAEQQIPQDIEPEAQADDKSEDPDEKP